MLTFLQTFVYTGTGMHCSKTSSRTPVQRKKIVVIVVHDIRATVSDQQSWMMGSRINRVQYKLQLFSNFFDRPRQFSPPQITFSIFYISTDESASPFTSLG